MVDDNTNVSADNATSTGNDNSTSNNAANNGTSNANEPVTVTNSDGSTTTTVTKDDGTIIKTTIKKDGSKTIITQKTDGSEYTTEVSKDGNTVTTTETKAPRTNISTDTSTTTNTTTDTTKSSETVQEVVDTRTAVQRIKGVDTYAPDDIIPKYCNVEIDGFQFVAEELTPSESYSRRNLIRTGIMGGGQATSRGEYIPRSWSFNTTIDYPKGKPDEYDKLWAYMSNKECRVVSQYIGDMTAEVQIQKTYPKGSGNIIKLSVTITEISQKDNTYNVKTVMDGFTTLTDNSSANIKEMENEDGDRVTVQTNVSDKHTQSIIKNLREVSKEPKRSDGLDTSDKNSKGQADSTKNNSNASVSDNVSVKTTTVNNTKSTDTGEDEVVHSPNNNEDYVTRNVEVKI